MPAVVVTGAPQAGKCQGKRKVAFRAARRFHNLDLIHPALCCSAAWANGSAAKTKAAATNSDPM